MSVLQTLAPVKSTAMDTGWGNLFDIHFFSLWIQTQLWDHWVVFLTSWGNVIPFSIISLGIFFLFRNNLLSINYYHYLSLQPKARYERRSRPGRGRALAFSFPPPSKVGCFRFLQEPSQVVSLFWEGVATPRGKLPTPVSHCSLWLTWEGVS